MYRSAISEIQKSDFKLPGLDYDEILAICGDRGRYQFILLVCFGLQNFLCALHYFSQTVSSFVPDHYCHHDKLENMSFAEIKEIYKNFDRPSCTKLEHVYGVNNVTKSREKCSRWIYNYDFGFRSMTTELNWVCESAYKSSVGQSFFFIGSVCGTLTFGYLADKLGRLPVLLFSNCTGSLGELLTVYSDKVWSYSVCRFVAGLSVDTDIYLLHVIVIEYLNPKWRTLGLNLMIGIFFCAGVASSPWIAVSAGNWRTFLYCTSIPVFLIIFYFFVVQESAQWLMTHNNIEGAIKRLKNVARINRRNVTEEQFDDFRKNFHTQKHEVVKENVINLFHGRRTRKITFILLYVSIAITVSFDTISRNMSGTGISALVTFSASALVIFPASLIICCFQNRIGRKGLSTLTMLISGIVLSISGIILSSSIYHHPIMLFCFVLAARLCASMTYDTGQQFAAELIPTCVRGQGVALIHVVGFAASFLAPYIILLGNYFKAAPSFISTVLYLIGALLCLWLPETAKKILPKTIKDLEAFGKNEKIGSFACCPKTFPDTDT